MRSRWLQLAALSAALAAPLALAGTGTETAPTAAANACAVRPGTTARIAVQGTRSVLVHVPRGRHGRVPLILALHGAYGSGAFMEGYSGLSRLGDRQGFGVVYPDAAGTFWRIGADDADVRSL